ncbi:carbohydrate kinase family protein [Cyclobacterium salsum]|uniref:hypothetical protein n=1 Tax=Cyclobacterium salsum TaxID=2666329 RepID=UPI0013911997|nr:hypothetical protein [Cyclobacterium salsum]
MKPRIIVIGSSCIKIQPGTHSGIALANLASDGEKSISVAPRTNSHLLPEDVHRFEEAFEGAKIVLAQLEIPVKTVEEASNVAQKRMQFGFSSSV